MQTVVILICTFDRPDYLRMLLNTLVREMASAGCKTVSVIVIDNGTQDVSSTVEAFRNSLPLEYRRAPGIGLVGARNMALKFAMTHAPDFLVFIDDDEEPEAGWLDSLVSTLARSCYDFAVGPVEPRFESPPPQWAPGFFRKSGEAFCTCNLIIRTSAIPRDERQWFQREFSASGGEDGEFLNRLAASGSKHTIARQALVWEHIPPHRVTARYIWRSGFRDGIVTARMTIRSKGQRHKGLAGNLLLAFKKAAYGANHLLWSLAGQGRFYRAVDDLSVASGLLLGSFGAEYKFYGMKAS